MCSDCENAPPAQGRRVGETPPTTTHLRCCVMGHPDCPGPQGAARHGNDELPCFECFDTAHYRGIAADAITDRRPDGDTDTLR